MTLKNILLVSLLAASVPAVALAQSAPAVPANVAFGTIANMPSLRDNTKKDTFTVTLKDAQVSTQLELTCSAGYTTLLIMRSDKACAVAGAGSIVNPANQQLLPRTQYAGGYTVKADGFTDGSAMSVNYLAVGRVQPSAAIFKGSMTLKPEVTSSGAAALRDTVLSQLNANGG